MSTAHGSKRPVVVITGTSRGIGNNLARRFLAEGYSVIGISRTDSNIDDSRFQSIRADLADDKQISQLADQLAEKPIAGLINNAGVHGPIKPFEDTPMEQWVHTFQVNLFGAASVTQLCIPSLRRNNGFIIFVSGGGSAFPRPNYSAYGVSKCGVIRLSEVLASELAPEVLVYCIAPGTNRTQMQEEVKRHGEIVRDEDYVDFSYPERLCLFLARNRDPRYSGKFIHVMDDYQGWDDDQLAPDANTLRRMDRRTLSRLVQT